MIGRMCRVGCLTVAISFSMLSTASHAQQGFIAGTQPDQRPQGAPVITNFEKDTNWYANALHGVSQPYPPSLRFLDDQGRWFTPFIHPGMTGHYDIRGWHTAHQ